MMIMNACMLVQVWIFGMLQATTLKRNLVPRFEEARKKDGFGISGFRQLGGLPPLKETFVGSLELLSLN